MELQNAQERFAKQGIKLAAISYDSQAILKDFSERHKITFPLLADVDSHLIREYQVLNEQATGMTKGMAHPGFFYIDQGGVIREKYFEAQYINRFTANNVIGKLFPELAEEVRQNIQAAHLQLTLTQSDSAVIAGSRVTLVAEIALPADTHVYAPGVKGYKPIQLTLHHSNEFAAAPAAYPGAKTLYLEAIRESVPVFDGRFQIRQDVTINLSKLKDGLRSLLASDKTLNIEGDLSYQACDKTVCYNPTSVPVKWTITVLPLDRERSPKAIQHQNPSS